MFFIALLCLFLLGSGLFGVHRHFAYRVTLRQLEKKATELAEAQRRSEQLGNGLEVAKAKVVLLELAKKEASEALKSREKRLEALVAESSRLEEANRALKVCLEDDKASQHALYEEMKNRFQLLADRLLEEKSLKLTKQNKAEIQGLLLPLKERIGDFQQQLAAQQERSIEGTALLKRELVRVNELYSQVKKVSQEATRAIIGDNRIQGNWGEVNVLRLLERSGLRKDEDYLVKEGFKNEDGKRLFPDIIIKLPKDRSIVMDVKVSLLHYSKACNEVDPQKKNEHLKLHLRSLKRHVKELTSKNYAQAYDLKGLDAVLMLLPVEPAFASAIAEEPTLFQEAYEQNVILVSPTTLYSMLSMVHHLWRHDAQNRNALEISRQGGLLYDQFVSFVEDLKKVGHQLALGQRSHENAIRRLSQGRGNLLSRAEALRKLGARASKQLSLVEEGGLP